jgi:hypothetical protein
MPKPSASPTSSWPDRLLGTQTVPDAITAFLAQAKANALILDSGPTPQQTPSGTIEYLVIFQTHGKSQPTKDLITSLLLLPECGDLVLRTLRIERDPGQHTTDRMMSRRARRIAIVYLAVNSSPENDVR